jgi:glycosyltransferase involved in cell wall biosynthesis
MRVAQVTYRYLPALGGAEVYVDALRRALRETTSEQTIYQAAVETALAGEAAAETSAADQGAFQTPRSGQPAVGIEDGNVVQIPVTRRTGLKLLDFNIALAARREEVLGNDVIIVHNPEHMSAWLAGPRTILVSHGATWTHERNPLRRAVRRWSMKSAFRRAGAVVANDSFVLREMGIPVPPGTRFREEVAPGAWFVPNAVDLHVFHPVEAGEPPAPPAVVPATGNGTGPLVLVPRNLSRSRGIDLAVRAFAASRELPTDSRLIIVGDAIPDMPSSRQYRAELDTLVRDLGLAGRVSFLGGVTRPDMPALYRATSLTLVPTRCSEGTSLAALESMASGVATLTTAVEGLLDLPAPHTPPRAEDIAALIDRTWPMRGEVGRRQRQAVEKDFSTELWEHSWRAIVTRTAERGQSWTGGARRHRARTGRKG